eukprot:TRINITY_DN59030_c0_g1_i1.p1 TRINITY_DN59030_c0_g1~~TRINITY_DN59030_c0_g1_i1.p1  ORF type:complete len:913 (+),score=165.27 TRINITY_DN59030_c0_g1_i1:94-2832(+)
MSSTAPLKSGSDRAALASKVCCIVRDHKSNAVLKHLNSGLADPKARHAEFDQDLMFFAAARTKQLGDAHRIAKRLAQLGVPTNSIDPLGQTPLFFAAREGNTECAKFLIDSACDVNHRDGNGQTPLFYAFYSGKMDCVHQLVQSRADLDLRDNGGRTAISCAEDDVREALEKSLQTQNVPSSPCSVFLRRNQPKASLAPSRRKPSRDPPFSSTLAIIPCKLEQEPVATLALTDAPKRRCLGLHRPRGVGEVDSAGKQESMLEWLHVRSRRNSSARDGTANAGTAASSQANVAAEARQRGKRDTLSTAAAGNTLAQAGEYHVRIPPVSHADRLRELECELVLDHYEMFQGEAWHKKLQPPEWCSFLSVVYDEDQALQAIVNILSGKAHYRKTLECIYNPLSNGSVGSESGPKTAGYVHICCAGDHIEIVQLKVERSHQRRGVGSLLLAASVRCAKQLGWGMGHLRAVTVASNSASTSLFKKFGFGELATIDKPVHSSLRVKVKWVQLGKDLQNGHARNAFVRQCELSARQSLNGMASPEKSQRGPRCESHYEALAVGYHASLQVIRAAYKLRVLETHPDKGGCAVAFRRVVQAYEVLSDPQQRAAYDATLRLHKRNSNAGFGTACPTRSAARAVLATMLSGSQALWSRHLSALRLEVLSALAQLIPCTSKKLFTCQQCSRTTGQGSSSRGSVAKQEQNEVQTALTPGIFKSGSGFVSKVGWHGFFCKTSEAMCLCQAVDWHIVFCQMRSCALQRLQGSRRSEDPLTQDELFDAMDGLPAGATAHPLFYSDTRRANKRLSTPWSADLQKVLQYRNHLESLAIAGSSGEELRRTAQEMQQDAKAAKASLQAARHALSEAVHAALWESGEHASSMQLPEPVRAPTQQAHSFGQMVVKSEPILALSASASQLGSDRM